MYVEWLFCTMYGTASVKCTLAALAAYRHTMITSKWSLLLLRVHIPQHDHQNAQPHLTIRYPSSTTHHITTSTDSPSTGQQQIQPMQVT